MAILDTVAVDPSDVKIRWQEQYVSAGLNEKMTELAPKGIYRGFALSPSGVWDVLVDVDGTLGDSVAVHESASGYTTTVRLTAAETLHGVDPAGVASIWYAILDVAYSTGVATTAELTLRDSLPIGKYVLLGTITIPTGAVALSADMFDQGFAAADWPVWQGKKEFDGTVKLDGGLEGGLKTAGEIAGNLVLAGATSMDNADAASLDTGAVSLISPDPDFTTWTLDAGVVYTYTTATKTRFGTKSGLLDLTAGAHTSKGIYTSQNLQADVTVLDRGYVFSCWVFWDSTDNPPDQVRVQVRVSGTAYNAGGQVYQQELTGADTWHRVIIPFAQDIAGLSTYVRIFDVNAPAKTAKVWVSGVKLERGTVATVPAQFSSDRLGNFNVDRHLRAEKAHLIDAELFLGGTLATPGVTLGWSTSRVELTDAAALPANISAGKLKLGTAHATPVGGVSLNAEENIVSQGNLYGLTGICFLGGTYAAPGAYLYANTASARVEVGAAGVPEKLSCEAIYVGTGFGDATAPYGFKSAKPIQITGPVTASEGWIEVGNAPPAALACALRVGTEGIENTGSYMGTHVVGSNLHVKSAKTGRLQLWAGALSPTWEWTIGLNAADEKILEVYNKTAAGATFQLLTGITLVAEAANFTTSMTAVQVKTGTGGLYLDDNAATITAKNHIVKVDDQLRVTGSSTFDGNVSVGAGTTITCVNLTASGNVSVGADILLNPTNGEGTFKMLEVTDGTCTSAAAGGFDFQKKVTVSVGGLYVTAGGLTVSVGGGAITGNLTVTGKVISSGASSEIQATDATFTGAIQGASLLCSGAVVGTPVTAITGDVNVGDAGGDFHYAHARTGYCTPNVATWMVQTGTTWFLASAATDYWQDASGSTDLVIPLSLPPNVTVTAVSVWTAAFAGGTAILYEVDPSSGARTAKSDATPAGMTNLPGNPQENLLADTTGAEPWTTTFVVNPQRSYCVIVTGNGASALQVCGVKVTYTYQDLRM